MEFLEDNLEFSVANEINSKNNNDQINESIKKYQ